MKINVITPRLDQTKFSGGIFSILKHADLLAKKGHTINVVPYPGSELPLWIDCQANFIIPKDTTPSRLQRHFIKLAGEKDFIKSSWGRDARRKQLFAGAIPEADMTIATLWETVELVAQYGKGKRVYMCQHFESIFEDSDSWRNVASAASYLMPLYKVVNSQWLESTIKQFQQQNGLAETMYRFVNGIDTSKFITSEKNRADGASDNTIQVISYGGRSVAWKGFQQMAEAVRIVREALPTTSIDWKVYGGASLPPDNTIAPYTDLGFLQQDQLAKAYQQADICLSASWYESFPLFPLEAMGCGLAVISGQFGVEDYARHGENCEIVNAKDPANIAESLQRLITDSDYRRQLGKAGAITAQQFSWENANAGLEAALQEISAQPNEFQKQASQQDNVLQDLLY